MEQQFNDTNIKIVYSGIQSGNMDLRFGNRTEVLTRRTRLQKQYRETPYMALVAAEGRDKIIDLDKSNLEKGWNILKCDGLMTTKNAVALVLFPADCIPLVVYAAHYPARALIHVGRKGAEKGIHTKIIDYFLEKHKTPLESLRVFIGPSIKQASYFFPNIEVGQKNSERWKPYINKKNDNYYIDVNGLVIAELVAKGIARSHMQVSDIDTGSRADYFSHARSVRSGDMEGRNTFIVLPGQ